VGKSNPAKMGKIKSALTLLKTKNSKSLHIYFKHGVCAHFFIIEPISKLIFIEIINLELCLSMSK
jgi:hypothetical protein